MLKRSRWLNAVPALALIGVLTGYARADDTIISSGDVGTLFGYSDTQLTPVTESVQYDDYVWEYYAGFGNVEVPTEAIVTIRGAGTKGWLWKVGTTRLPYGGNMNAQGYSYMPYNESDVPPGTWQADGEHWTALLEVSCTVNLSNYPTLAPNLSECAPLYGELLEQFDTSTDQVNVN